MLLRQERIAFGLLCVVTGVIMVSAVALGGIDKTSLAQEFRDDTPDGVLARVTGEIRDLEQTRTGGHLTARVENVRIFIPSTVADGTALAEGDLVCITGTVGTYQGKKEIVVQSHEDITVQERRG
jgi:DNA/RNA endonuclease YhcR with UshA esterase domain